jgi:type I restriction enzyme S subunit
MELKPGYKQTEVGVIPEDWQTVQIGSLGTFAKGKSISKDEASSGDIPCVRYGEIYTHHNDILRSFNSRISAEVARSSKRLKKVDLLFAGSGETKEEIGKCVAFLGNEEAYAGGDIIILSPSKGVSSFFGYLFNAPIVAHQKASKGQGDAIVHISASALSSIKIPLPPTEAEQRAIAGVLGDVDALIGALEKLIAKKRNLKQAAMQQLLTGQTRLPGFSGEWEAKRLEEIGTFSKGKGIKKDEVVADGIPCIRYGEIYTHYNDYIRRFHSFIPLKVARDSKRLKKGDLLFAGSGETADEIGKCVAFLGDEEAYAGGDIVILSPKGQNSMYLGYLMNHSSITEQKARMGQGDAIVHIHAWNLGQLNLILPLLDEQTAIAEVLSDMDAEIATLEQRLTKTRALKQGMMQELLTGKTRLV